MYETKKQQFNRAKGGAGEGLAGIFLAQHGFELVQNNYRNKHGEIDIIAIEYRKAHPSLRGANATKQSLSEALTMPNVSASNTKQSQTDPQKIFDPIYHFIEVKYRLGDAYGLGREAVGKQKQKRIRNTAQYYLIENGLHDKVYSCFDVIEITGTLDNPRIEHLQNCF